MVGSFEAHRGGGGGGRYKCIKGGAREGTWERECFSQFFLSFKVSVLRKKGNYHKYTHKLRSDSCKGENANNNKFGVGGLKCLSVT